MKLKLSLFCVLLLLTAHLGYAQTKTVSGTVISGEDNLPMIGANVKVKGTTIGQTTDFDGNFKITNVPEDAKQLEIS